MQDHQRAEAIAAERLQWLAPLLAAGLDAAQIAERKAALCAQTGLSERTIRRYLARYRTDDFAGLQPRDKGSRRLTDGLPDAIVQEAVLLRREVPRRSVAQIIQILEWEGRITPGQVKRSTLQEVKRAKL